MLCGPGGPWLDFWGHPEAIPEHPDEGSLEALSEVEAQKPMTGIYCPPIC